MELPEQQCCGIPFFDIGDIDSATEKARFNVQRLKHYVDAGFDIVVPVPTCALQIKYEYPLLLPDDPDVKAVSERVYDVHEYLFKLHQEKRFNKDFMVSLGNIAYHIPCHLKSLNVGYRAVALMRLIPNTKVQIIERCSGHDGTFGVRKETFDMSIKVGSKLFEDMKNSNADLYVSDCPLSGNHIELMTGKRRYFELIGRTIERALRKDCLIIFFGSAVRENFGRASDIDVALFCSEPLSFTEYSRLLSEIEELPILRDVDLVDLWRVDSYDFLSKILEEGLFWKSSEELMRLLRRRLEGLRKSEVKTS